MPKMCKCYKNLKSGNTKEYMEMAGDCSYVCKKCGRFAADKKYLCYPMERGDISSGESGEYNKSKSICRKLEKKKIKKLKVLELREIIAEEVGTALKKNLEEKKENVEIKDDKEKGAD